MQRFLSILRHEPLTHFTILAAILYGAYVALAPADGGGKIVVSQATIAGLRADHTRRHGGPPSPAEEQMLIDRFIDGEILYREALALGLDRGDVIVRRRLVQKMEFLNERSVMIDAPTEAQLSEYLAAHADRYAQPARYSFEHVFIASGRHDDVPTWSATVLERLRNGADPQELGDPFVRGRHFQLRTIDELRAVFGDDMPAGLASLPVGVWRGPLRSAYGEHLVRVSEVRVAEAPALATVYDAVRRDWEENEREAALRVELDRLRERYEVRIEALGSEAQP